MSFSYPYIYREFEQSRTHVILCKYYSIHGNAFFLFYKIVKLLCILHNFNNST